MILDINACLDRGACIDELLTRTELGCYVTRDANEASTIRHISFVISEDRRLTFQQEVSPQGPGDRFNGSLFFFESQGSCADLTPESGCGEGCLLRLKHTDVTIGVQPTTITFNENGACDLLSEDESIQSECQSADAPDLDIMIVDMGDMGNPADMGDMDNPADMSDLMIPDLDPSSCADDVLNTPCEVDDPEVQGVCATGTYVCQNEQLFCQPNERALEECDLIDNDCDGTVDEIEFMEECERGVGACLTRGALACVGGEVECITPPIGDPIGDDTTCDGVDDDCDGQSDEAYLPEEVTCGVGECARVGVRLCEEGGLIVMCTPGEPEELDSICDTLDADCDGQVDEDFAVIPITCGVGACSALGQTVCEEGSQVDQCIPNEPAVDDPTCDGIDDDCDGRTDEGYVNEGVSCGVGACQEIGERVCLSGELVTQCTPREPAPTDATCDLIDDDCDGRFDEDYIDQAVECGVGVCTRSGLVICQEGALINDCTPGDPARVDDPTCDGLDDNCNGETDEDFTSYPGPSCGQGDCQQDGIYICQAGALINQCTPLDPATEEDAADGVCNQRDEDCDGDFDEDYPTQATTCGVGVCERTGELTCIDGVITDTCNPTELVGEVVDDCDGLDNDCNGEVDEDFISAPVLCDLATSCVASARSTCEAGVPGDTCDLARQRDSDSDGVGDPCSWIGDPQLTIEILRHEVTFGAYRDCVDQGGCITSPLNYNVSDEVSSSGCDFIDEGALSAEPETNPLRCVVPDQLAEYCAWIGGRLPSRSELLNDLLPVYAPLSCDNSVSGSCPGANGLPAPVCSLEATPGSSPICDLGGNVYEITSDTYFSGTSEYMWVCFDDYLPGEAILERCASQKISEPIQRVGGRCVRDLTP